MSTTSGPERLGVPRISFMVPYYRDQAYLLEAIESVRAQTLSDWELVVVDDHGPDPAEAAVSALDDPRISYVRNSTNLGLAANWNECVRRATAPYVTLLHADDRLEELYAELVVAALDEHPQAVAAFTDATIIGPDGDRSVTLPDVVKRLLPRPRSDHELSGDPALAGLLRGNYIVCPSLCLRRAAVGSAPFDPTLRFVPDWQFTTRVLLEGGTLWAVRQPLVRYRRHASSQTSILTESDERFVEELSFLRRIEEQAAGLDLPRAAATARRRVTVRGHLLVRVLLDVVGGRPSARSRWSLLRDDLRRRAERRD